MNLTRPAFNAACAALVGTLDEISASQAAALWHALVPSTAQSRYGKPRWSPVAVTLREPLLREIDVVRQQAQRGSMRTSAEREAHGRYFNRLHDILLRIDRAMRDNGHWRVAGDPKALDEERLPIIVTNERDAGRPAGCANWVQWEDPKIVAELTSVFVTPHWKPYNTAGPKRRGRAAEARKLAAWTEAFDENLRTIGSLGYISGIEEQCPGYRVRLDSFHEMLRGPEVRIWIDDAIRVQLLEGRSPDNRRFCGVGRSLWHALDPHSRIALASSFHALLAVTRDKLDALGKHDLATQCEPSHFINPFALTEAEKLSLNLN